SSTGNAPPGDFQIGNPSVYYDIATSATYSGDITICINYAGITFSGTPRLFHYENGAWVDRTTSVDSTTQTVCATVSSLSPFALFSQPAPQAPAITSADSATFQLGAAGGFTVLSSGSPTSALSESGALPAGVSFVDNHDGSAVLTGTPTAGGTFNLTISATNAAGNTTQNFVLTVSGTALAPFTLATSFTPSTILMTGISTLSFTITNPNPSVSLSVDGGVIVAVPAGLTFPYPSVVANTTSTCQNGGIVTTSADGTSFTMNAFTLAAGASCTITAPVTGTTAGTFTASNSVSALYAGISNTATASLTVNKP